MNGPGGIGESDSCLFEPAEDLHVDFLLGVRVQEVVRLEQVVDHLEGERRVHVLLEMGPVETDLLLRFHDVLEHGRDGFEFVGRGLVDHHQREDGKRLLDEFVVLYMDF